MLSLVGGVGGFGGSLPPNDQYAQTRGLQRQLSQGLLGRGKLFHTKKIIFLSKNLFDSYVIFILV